MMEDRWVLLIIAVVVILDLTFCSIRINFLKYLILFLKIGLEMIYITMLDSELMNLKKYNLVFRISSPRHG